MKARATLRPALAATAAACACAGLVVGWAASPAHADAPDCTGVAADSARVAVDVASRPLARAGVVTAQEWLAARGITPGAGVTVAVVSSGVARGAVPPSPVVAPSFARADQIADAQGTVVAGLIAGAARADGKPVGVAPGAKILDVRVFDTPHPADLSQVGVEPDRVAAALRWIDAHRNDRGADLRIVAVPVQTEPSKPLDAAVRRLAAHGVVVVAAAGDQQDDGSEAGDSGKIAFPGGYREALTVGAADRDSAALLPNPETDLAAPTLGAVSVGLNAGNCVVGATSTAWAVGEVAGALALLRSAYPHEDVATLVERLVSTAGGRPDVRSPYTGAGLIHLDQAATATLEPSHDGELGQTHFSEQAHPVAAPVEPPDLLASTREHAVWWGLFGSGVLVVALILRPLVRRRG